MNRLTADKPLVEASALSKQYNGHRVVDSIDFSIPRGKCFGFLGPNGAGKTTTLRMILGLAPSSGGALSVFGLAMPQSARQVRARVGVVPQSDNLDPDFSVIENLRVYATYFGIPRTVVEPRIQQLLNFASLSDKANAKTDTLSGGMKRRLTIARALINEPELVVLDEPTTGLDPQARHLIWARLTELRAQGATLILTTHYMEEAERLCDELVIMDNGRILDYGTTRALIERHLEPEVIEIRGENNAMLQLQTDPDRCRLEQIGASLYCYTDQPAPILNQLQKTPDLTFLHRPAGLEDVFLKLTGRELRE